LDRTLRAIGRYAEARKLAQDTQDRDRRILGEDHPDTLISVTSLTIDLRYLGKTETAQITDGNLRGSRHSCRQLSGSRLWRRINKSHLKSQRGHTPGNAHRR
jgi:Tetratricopeptide repeat